MIVLSRDDLQRRIQNLATHGIFIGTSSWKYAGWRGMFYDEARYIWRGRFAESRFERNCLAEYAEVFRTVSVDASYYAFPTVKFLEGLAGQVPDNFRFGFKVTDDITLKNFPNLPRFGVKAGRENPFFLSAEMFEREFLKPCESIREKIGILMFEFSRFYPSDFKHGRDFVAVLDAFFAKLPTGWPYGVELRNRLWLTPEYFACLARHGITHVYSSWTEMPSVGEQIQLSGSDTSPTVTAARFLLKPGRSFEQAIKAFQPYERTKEINEEARQAGAALIRLGKKNPGKKTYIFINNRLEGNALQTIKAILDIVGDEDVDNVPLTKNSDSAQMSTNDGRNEKAAGSA